MTKLREGDLVVNDILKTSNGYPYVIEIKEIKYDIIIFYHNGQSMCMSISYLRKADFLDIIWGKIWDRFFK